MGDLEIMAVSAEFEAVRGQFARICDCISESDIERFAGELFQYGLISEASHQAAIASALPARRKVAQLVAEAMNKVKNSPDDFDKLVSILESRDKRLASTLRSDYATAEVPTFRVMNRSTSTVADDDSNQVKYRPGKPQAMDVHFVSHDQVKLMWSHAPPEHRPFTLSADYKPGKPYATEISYNSINITWQKPKCDGIQHYHISYRSLDDPSNTWSSLMTANSENEYDFSANPEKSYVFKVSAVTTAGHSSFSEVSDLITTKVKPWSAQLIRSCKMVSSSNPRIYQLPLHYTVKKNSIRKATVRKNAPAARYLWSLPVPHKVLMLVGATGAGKSTLIDSIANYIMGVDWEDKYRFKLISEETAHDQAKSQTKCITAYTFYKQEGSPLPYTLTVIDTPGFGDTGGPERDKEIVKQIEEFFSTHGDEGIDQLHGIGFVTQAPQARLTPTQRYVFDTILSVFGKYVADNIFLMVTFADGHRPPVIDATRHAGVPFKSYFMFNNSALFASNQADEFDQMFWRLGQESFQKFFSLFSITQPISLQLSKEALQEREQLKTLVIELVPHFKAIIMFDLQAKKNMDQTVLLKLNQAKRSFQRLQQIALEHDYMINVDDVNTFIRSEKEETRPGWRERVRGLEECLEFAKTLEKVKHSDDLGWL